MPIPRATHKLGSALIPLNNGVFNEGTLPNSALQTEFVAIADVNNDGMLDIVFGNLGKDSIIQNNQLLINAGDGNFNNAVDLPGGALYTSSVAIGNINNDGMLDIIIGNFYGINQLLMNAGDGAFNDAVELSSCTLNTTSVATGDMNNDGLLDIIIGNENQSNQLLINAGDGTFNDIVDLPSGAWKRTSVAIADMNNDSILGGSLYTQSLQIVDMNNDGLLDIIIGKC
jgi:hypothetical protein